MGFFSPRAHAVWLHRTVSFHKIRQTPIFPPANVGGDIRAAAAGRDPESSVSGLEQRVEFHSLTLSYSSYKEPKCEEFIATGKWILPKWNRSIKAAYFPLLFFE